MMKTNRSTHHRTKLPSIWNTIDHSLSILIPFRVALILLCALGFSALQAAGIENGDIVFQRSTSRLSDAIATATRSEYTHVGVVFITDGKPFVYEAVQPVKRTPLDEWIKRGRNGKYEIKRLRDRERIDFAKVQQEALSYLGKNYDLQFRWTDEKFYCSELVWKAYQKTTGIELGSLKQLRTFDLSSSLVRQKLAEHYGKNIPYDMQVISPACIFASELLITVPQKQ